jgi:hypothetical protein
MKIRVQEWFGEWEIEIVGSAGKAFLFTNKKYAYKGSAMRAAKRLKAILPKAKIVVAV